MRKLAVLVVSTLILMHAPVAASPARLVVSPWVLARGQADTRDLARLARDIYRAADARTDREKAEAIWRFLLTDGRFVEPGQFYHIAGWAYEEPLGEVLDPLKLLNSYGFGLCYQVAPLMEALFEAGGFADARSWFLTGHTVCEVFYDGAYHMYDSDMLGFTTVGDGDPRSQPVASVRQLEQDENIILGKLKAPDVVDSAKVIFPWYPADVRARAMKGYAGIFTSVEDNYLFPFRRYPAGHSMDFALRPGEKLTLFYAPESEGLYYLPYKKIKGDYLEFPREIPAYDIRTGDGPQSQKDQRRWATGRVEYNPVLSRRESFYPKVGGGFNENLRLSSGPGTALTRERGDLPAQAVFEMASPWVLIDAEVSVYASISSPAHRLTVEVSTDCGRLWQGCGSISGPFFGPWKTGVGIRTVSEHGALSAVSGKYGFLIRLTLSGPGPAESVNIGELQITGLMQINPRNLPRLAGGMNELVYRPGPSRLKRSLPVKLERVRDFAARTSGVEYVLEDDNPLLIPSGWGQAEMVFEVAAPDDAELEGFSAGGRFLALHHLAPEKLTAETRHTRLNAPDPAQARGSLDWSLSPNGPWIRLWSHERPGAGLDGETIERVLAWPEVDLEVNPGPGVRKVFVRYRLQGMALDDIRLAVFTAPPGGNGQLVLTHEWISGGNRVTRSMEVPDPGVEYRYLLDTGRGEFRNLSLSFECPAQK